VKSLVNDRSRYPRGAEAAFAKIAVELGDAKPADFNVSIALDSDESTNSPSANTVLWAWLTESGGGGPVGLYTYLVASFPAYPFFKIVWNESSADGSGNNYFWLVGMYP